MKIKLLSSFFIGILITSLFVAYPVQKASATYDSGRIIDDAIFLNTSTMSRDDIQNFLVGKNSGLATTNIFFDCASTGMSAPYYQNAGAPCGQTVPASTIIYYAAQIYGVNPQVILATIQKEQSAITTPVLSSWQLNQVMGYGCPDSGGCGASNFLYQIDNGVWLLRFHMERARGNMNYWFTSTTWVCGSPKNYYKPSLHPYQNVNFYDDAGVLYRTEYIQNPTTSSFYCYTPHTYNNPRGLYGLPAYGTTGQYYSGSYNFVLYFERWFGSTTTGIGIESMGEVYNLRTEPNTYNSRVVTQAQRSKITQLGCYQNGGGYYLNNQYGNMWVKTVQPVSAWVAADTAMLEAAKSQGSQPCAVSKTVVYRAYNPLRQRHFWTIDPGERDFVLNTLHFTEGAGSFDTVSLSSEYVGQPVWRLYNRKRETHFWTADPNERNFVKSQLGFEDEGFAYNVSYPGENTRPVWRFYDKKAERHFWTADPNERNFVVNTLGFQDEGEAFRIPQ